MSDQYDQLTARLISLLDGDILPLPTFGDLERHEQRIAIAVQEVTGMTPEHWATLDKPSREPWLEKTITALRERQELQVSQSSTGDQSGGNASQPNKPDDYTFGDLIGDLESSESAYAKNKETTDRVRSQQGSIVAHWWEIQSAVLRWQPDPKRMPGIDRIELICDARFGRAFQMEDLRKLRAELCHTHNLTLDAANQLTLIEVADLINSSTTTSEPSHSIPPNSEILRLLKTYKTLSVMKNAQKRGFAFEAFLNEVFDVYQLAARGSFRVAGEQIDGSFALSDSTFVVEARWRVEPANTADLLVLRGKAEKSEWTRGLFISINGFSDLTSDTHMRGRRANLICMSGEDLLLVLNGKWRLDDALRAKLRHTGETAEVYVPLSKLGEPK